MKFVQIISAVLTILVSFSLYGQGNEDSLILKNKVKAIYEVKWKNFQLDKLIEIDTIGYRIYNDDFQLIEKYSYFNSLSSLKYRYSYNSDELLVKKVKLEGQNDKFEKAWEFEYNKDDKIIKEIIHWKNSKYPSIVTFSYNNQNQLISTHHLSSKNEVYKSISHSYYETGELYEKKYEENYNKSGFKIKRFDKCGNLIYFFENSREDSAQVNGNYLSFCPTLLKKENYLIDTLLVECNKEAMISYTLLQDKERKSVYKYDSLGQIINIAKYLISRDDSIYQSIEELYNADGKLIDYRELYSSIKCVYNPDIKTVRIHKRYEYLQNGMLSKVYFLDEKEEFTEVIEYKIICQQ